MKKLLIGALLASTLPAVANGATIVSENFESGPGAFTLNGNVYLATGLLTAG